MTAQVSAQLRVPDAGMSGRGHVTTLSLSWYRDDPLAVHLELSAFPDHPALPRGTWLVLRDFLRYGVEEPTGDGAVRIRPAGEQVVELELAGPGGRPYRLHVPAADVCAFLDATEALVPTGAEGGDAELDALINRLLEY